MPLESSRQGLQLWLRPRPDRRSAEEIIVPQSRRSSILSNFGTPETKSHLDEGVTKRCKVYYMGEGDGFPRVRTVVSLVSPKSHVAHPSTKGASTLC
jgi:hypothetical protein